MIVLLDLEKKVISYQTTTPFVQGTDSRNIIKLLVPHSEVVDLFDAQIAYVLQSGRTTIKVANSGMEDTTETINDVIYNIINFDLPRMATSLAGNIVATLFITTSTGEKYKFNVYNNVLEAAEVEALEDALADDEVATALNTLESVVALLQTQMANRVINGVNGVPIDISSSATGGDAHIKIEKTNNVEHLKLNNGNADIDIFTESSTNKAKLNLYSYNDVVVTGIDRVLLQTDTYELNVIDGVGVAVTDSEGNTLFKVDELGVNSSDSIYIRNKEVATQEYANDLYNVAIEYVNEQLTYKADKSTTYTKTQTDSLLSGKVDKSLVGYIELYGDATHVLTTEQQAEVNKPYCIIKYTSSSTSNIWTYYYKMKKNFTTSSIEFAEFKLTVNTTDDNLSRLGLTKLVVSDQTYSWWFSGSLDFTTYSATVIDGKVSNLQSEIDGINAGQNLADIVADLTALNNLDTSKLQANDKVQVLVDSNHDNASTVYNWTGSAWSYIGKYGQDGYTKSEEDALLATKQNVIDSSHKLASDLVDDTNSTHKFVTASEKETIDEIGYIELETSRSLTASELLEAQKKYCIINYDDDTYYKKSEDTTTITFKCELTETVSSSQINPNVKTIVVTKADGSITTSTIGLYLYTSYGSDNRYEQLSNKATSISASSTDTEYPSAKCVYDLVGDIETLLASI